MSTCSYDFSLFHFFCFQTSIVVLALYDFAAEEEGELSFKKGDKIEVINKADRNWWTGKLVATGAMGQFPSTYTKEITE